MVRCDKCGKTMGENLKDKENGLYFKYICH